ncbi:MAG: hypothetical protein QF692_08280 [Alphaproteobacteria bacterium]|jgi:hypothetical protein|nr:hypothetical protein [Alphaproteobacteria bacterium]MDP7223242.1 hypothetical protein [Alphaproteobacteria bacterium]
MGFFSSAKDWLSDTASSVASSVSHAVTHPRETFEAASDAVSGFASYAVENPGRMLQVAGQGVVNGVTGTVGAVGDLGLMAYNHGIRHGVNLVPGVDLDKTDFSCTESLSGLGQFTEPRNDYERAMMYGTQGVFEVGTFIAVSAATAGAGGAALAAVRGGSIAARAGTAAVNTARIMSPFNSAAALTLEGAVTTHSITTNIGQDQQEAEFANQMVVDGVISEMDATIDEYDTQLERMGISASEPVAEPETTTLDRDASAPRATDSEFTLGQSGGLSAGFETAIDPDQAMIAYMDKLTSEFNTQAQDITPATPIPGMTLGAAA